jgi:phage tail-like protein
MAKKAKPASHFRLTLGGKESAGVFREAEGLEHDAEAPPVPGTVKLKNGVDENVELRKWFEQASEHQADQVRLDGTIEIIDDEGTVTSTYSIRNGWPIKYSGGTMLGDGQESGAVTEIEIEYEGLERA